MKVTSDRIKARAQQLRKNGFRLSGSMVRSTLELNAGARTPQPTVPGIAPAKTEKQPSEPESTKAA